MLARTFLRLCALEAVCPSALPISDDAAPWPTMGKSYWFDSRLDPIEDIAENERRPIGVMYTEGEQQKRIAQTGNLQFESTVDLVFEISVIATDRAENGDFIPGTAYTDAELEASLDAFENQVWHALIFGPTGRLFRRMAKKVHSFQSHPMRSSEESGRLAMRTVLAKVELADVCYQALPSAPPVGLDRLPPVLREIAAALDGSTYYAKLATAIAGAAPVMPVGIPLKSVGLTVDHAPTGTQIAVGEIDLPQP
jgi:hypothetical protein